MKKIISILLALSMLFSLNTVAFAAESGTTDELQIVEENGTRTVSLNDGELTYIVTYDTVSKSTETLLSELQKAAKGNAVAQAILRYQQDNSFKCKSDSDQISIQKFFPTCGLMDEYFRWLLL